MMACFAPGRQLGSVGQAFMEAMVDMSEDIIDADSGEKMEKYLDKKTLQAGAQLPVCPFARAPRSAMPSHRQKSAAAQPCLERAGACAATGVVNLSWHAVRCFSAIMMPRLARARTLRMAHRQEPVNADSHAPHCAPDFPRRHRPWQAAPAHH